MASFGVLVPGRGLQMSWEPAGPGRLVSVLADTGSVDELIFMALPGPQLPRDMGASLYFSNNGSVWALLGSITLERPSILVRTPFGLAEPVSGQVQLGVSLEPLHVIQNIEQHSVDGKASRSYDFALRLAKDLYNYTRSFSAPAFPSASIESVTISGAILDKWLDRFKTKYRRNPNFLFTDQDN